jgi:hypothetical protein
MMPNRAPQRPDQRAPRPRSQFQQADYSEQYNYLQQQQQDQRLAAQAPGQRNSGSHLAHLAQYDNTSQSQERPQSEDDSGAFAQYVDPFGLQYHDKSRYSGIRAVRVTTCNPSLTRIKLIRYDIGCRDSNSNSCCAQIPRVP